MADDIHFDKVCFLLNGEGADNTIPLFERSKYKRKLSCGTATRIGKIDPVNSSNHISLTNNSTDLIAYNILSGDLGYSDFTIEFWFRPYSISSSEWGTIFQLGADNAVNGVLGLVRESNTVPMSLRLDYFNDQWTGQFTNTTLTDEVWNHIAVVRKDNVLALYLNGIKTYERIGESADGSYLRGKNLSLGRRLNSTSGIKADYASVRITEGFCRYTTNFTPNTEDHPDYGYVISGKLNGVDSSEKENVSIRAYRRSSGEFLGEVKSFNSSGDTLFDDVSLLLDISAKKVIDASKYNSSVFPSKQMVILEGQGPGGTNALNMNGSGFIHFPDLQMMFGKGDFTVEAHLYFNSLTGDQTFFDTRPAGNNGNYINVGIDPTVITYYTQSTVRISAAHNIILNDWNHIAVCKKDGYVRLFVNGVQKGPAILETFSQELGDLGFILGANGFNRALYLLNAKISSFRVTRAARYDSDFTVPSNIFPKSKSHVGVAGDYSIKVGSSEEVQVVAISPDSNEVFNDILYRVDNQ